MREARWQYPKDEQGSQVSGQRSGEGEGHSGSLPRRGSNLLMGDLLNASWDADEPQEAGGSKRLLGKASKAREHLAGDWGWGAGTFLDTLHVRGMLVSGTDVVPPRHLQPRIFSS